MTDCKNNSRAHRGPAGFTLIELLITISIMAMMAGMILFAASSAQETAKEAKTKALIAKLDSIMKAKWDAYKTRRVPVTIPPGTPPLAAAKLRLDGLRDLMRMELPDRWSDIALVDNSPNPSQVKTLGAVPPITPTGVPFSSVAQGFYRKVYNANTLNPANPSLTFQNAECLYMIVMSSTAEDVDLREIFSPGDVKDTDGDGFPEFVDGWGQPIRFLRWAPGFQLSELQIMAQATATPPGTSPVTLNGASLSTQAGAYVGGTIIVTNPTAPFSMNCVNAAHITGYDPISSPGAPKLTFVPPPSGPPPSINGSVVLTAPDPFDPAGFYTQGGLVYGVQSPPSFATYPLIYSAGPDKVYGIVSDATPPIGSMRSPTTATPNLNPVCVLTPPAPLAKELIGNARDLPAEPNFRPSGWLDNIHNHMLNLK